jgi:predicted molibdopterin-dependent oxidoreductase YjgC
MTRFDPRSSLDDSVTVSIDGKRVSARKGQTIAAVMEMGGERIVRQTRKYGKARGLYCGMGMCFDCIVVVNGKRERACMRKVEDGMQIALLRAAELKSQS